MARAASASSEPVAAIAGPLPWPRRALAPLSRAYETLVRARNLHFDRHPDAMHRAGVPVVSVGNLTVGGTGKTPMVIEIVQRLIRRGRRPAVLTRGYAARPGETADEVRELHAALPGALVVVHPRRVDGAAAAVQAGADCCVLDDGFQHRRLARDVDIVLLDALDPWGGGWMLPAGRLREPPSGLRRATLAIVTRANQVAPAALAALEHQARSIAPHLPILHAAVEAVGLRGAEEQPAALEDLEVEAVLPVSGIGNPRTFEQLVGQHAGRTCPPLRFRDHHRYTARDVERIQSAAREHGADRVVTTRKDWVKLAPLWPSAAGPHGGVPLHRLDVRLALGDDGPLMAALRRLW